MASASIIGQGTVVRGNVRGTGSLEVRGRVEGDIEVDGDVALGEEAKVRGNISGAQLLIAGQVAGDLRGTEAVLLERGARVAGDLVAPRIGVADGALVRGQVRTEGEASAPRRAAVSPARRAGDFGTKPKPVPAAAPRPAAAPPAKPPPAQSPQPAAAGAKPATPAPEAASTSAEAPSGPPAPVVPALGKNVRGKKKSKRS